MISWDQKNHLKKVFTTHPLENLPLRFQHERGAQAVAKDIKDFNGDEMVSTARHSGSLDMGFIIFYCHSPTSPEYEVDVTT